MVICDSFASRGGKFIVAIYFFESISCCVLWVAVEHGVAWNIESLLSFSEWEIHIEKMRTRRNATLTEFISTRLEKKNYTDEWMKIDCVKFGNKEFSFYSHSFFFQLIPISSPLIGRLTSWNFNISNFFIYSVSFSKQKSSETGEKNKRVSCMFDLSSVERALIKIPWIPMLSCVPTSIIHTLCSLSIDIRYALWVGLHHSKTMTVSSQWLRNLILSGTSTSQIFEQKKSNAMCIYNFFMTLRIRQSQHE